jgi:predicted transcriptional regulator
MKETLLNLRKEHEQILLKLYNSSKPLGVREIIEHAGSFWINSATFRKRRDELIEWGLITIKRTNYRCLHTLTNEGKKIARKIFFMKIGYLEHLPPHKRIQKIDKKIHERFEIIESAYKQLLEKVIPPSIQVKPKNVFVGILEKDGKKTICVKLPEKKDWDYFDWYWSEMEKI